MAKHRPGEWHPLIREILALLTREAGYPELDEQLALAAQVMGMEKRERDTVVAQLWSLTQRLAAADEGYAARIVESIVVMTSATEISGYCARRILASRP